jgi:hypothetical protein
MTPAQRTVVDQLRPYLQAEVIRLREAVRLAEDKQRAVIAADTGAIAAVVAREEAGQGEQRRLRQLREMLVRQAAQAFTLRPADARLGVVADAAPEPQRGELLGLRGELQALAERLNGINERTQILIRQSMVLVRDLLQVLVGDPLGDGYDRRGMQGGGQIGNGRLLDLAG